LQLTAKIKIVPTRSQRDLLRQTSYSYIKTVNKIVSWFSKENEIFTLSSKDVIAHLPSAVKNQAIRDAKSVFVKKRKINREIVLKKPVCIWNNQNYKIRGDVISFPVMIDGKSKRISVEMLISDYHANLLKNKLGALRITKKSNKWFAQISVDMEEMAAKKDGKIMGVDLGITVPAVAYVDNKTKFFGNGRQNKYVRRKYASKRKKLGINKKIKTIKKSKNKEQLWMKDQDHKISRKIINFAMKENVSHIRLELLKNIRNTARTSRKNKKNLHKWSFYRVKDYIEYKAKQIGIIVEYINPKNTSRSCPMCKKINLARGRKYSCDCGFNSHRDRVGAMNISSATVVSGVAVS
jgi:putative transposase